MRRVALSLLGIFALAALGAYVYANEILTGAVERGGERAFGVETRLAVLRISPLSGGLALSQLSIANPPGFAADYFLTLGEGRVEMSLTELRGEPAHVRRIELQDVRISIESGARGTNYGALLEHASSGDSRAADDDGGGTVIDELVIRGVHAELRLGRQSYEVDVPEIRLTGIGDAGPDGIQLSELVAIGVKAILAAIAKQGVDLPGALVGDLNRQLARAGVPKVELPHGVQERADKLGRGLGEASEAAGKLAEGLRGLLGTPDD